MTQLAKLYRNRALSAAPVADPEAASGAASGAGQVALAIGGSVVDSSRRVEGAHFLH